MRTKTTLAAAAILAAGLASSMAQGNVYSLNVVGYVNVTCPGNGKLTLVSNPFKQTDGNYTLDKNVVLTDADVDTAAIIWDGANWQVNPYYGTVDKWLGVVQNPGQSFFIQTQTSHNPRPDVVVTFVGEVAQGADSNGTIPATAGSAIASRIPVAERQPGSAVGGVDDAIFPWDMTAQNWGNNAVYVNNGSDPTGWYGVDATLNGLQVPVAGGLFYANFAPITAVTWNRNFTVQ